ncbi:MAG TPA: hypothetical protein VGI82_02895 [Chitinophagaceae bacterium]
MGSISKWAFILISFLAMAAVKAQTNTNTLAYEAYRNKKWSEAEKQFTQYLSANHKDTFSFYYLGMAQVKQAKYKEAVNSFMNIYPLELSVGFINELRFELAKSYAGLNDKERALQFLGLAASNGASFSKRLEDTAFAGIRSDPSFIGLNEKMIKNATPCLYNDKYKKLDFFVGTWDVYIGNNYENKVAVDTVTKFYGGCSVDEKFRWLSGDYRGESISFFDDATQKFKMCWAGKSGDIRNFQEVNSEKNKILFLAVTTGDSKKQMVHRRMAITYDPDKNTVHELIENSYDLGETWEVDFDALFKKAAGAN